MSEVSSSAHRTVPSQIALTLSSKSGPAVKAYVRYLEGKLLPFFPTKARVDSVRVRTPLLHVQRDMRSRSFRPRTSCPSDVYRVITVHELANDSGSAGYDDLDDFDAVVVNSPSAHQALAGRTSRAIHLMPYGSYAFAPVTRSASRKLLGLPEDRNIVFSFSFEDIAVSPEVARAAKRMRRTIFLVGGLKGHATRLRLRWRRMSLPDNVVILEADEAQTNLHASAADVLLLPDHKEARSFSVNPTLHRLVAAGRPIVGTAGDPSLFELDSWGGSCRYTRNDAESLEHTLTSLMENQDLSDTLGQRALALADETSWERVARMHMELYGRIIGDFFGQSWYDEDYYVGSSGGKEFFSGEKQQHWSYFNPDGEWTGAKTVMQAVKAVLDPRNMLSVGEGRGTFVAYASDVGIDARGIDFSRWAVAHPYARAKDMVEWGDARDLSRFPDGSFDLVFASDLMEHIYLDDLDVVIGEIRRVSRKWVLYNNGGTEIGNLPPTFIKKGELPPKELQGTAAAGHVILQPCKWWEEKLSGGGWVSRPDLVDAFRSHVGAVNPLIIGNWKCVIITEKREG